MPNITIDFTEGLTIDEDSFSNECRTLKMLTAGLFDIAYFLKGREDDSKKLAARKIQIYCIGTDFDGTKDALDLIACRFHWFGVSICNYARLVGYFRGTSVGEFSRLDLRDSANHKTVRESVDKYMKSITELSDVRIWRNKVAAHFAITDPHVSDNISTLDMSVMFPVGFVRGKYRVNNLTLRQKNSTGTFVSELPNWSVTEVFEQLIPRYWPYLASKGPNELAATEAG